MVFKLWQKQIWFYGFLPQGFLHVLAWDDIMNFGCDAGVEMMEDELEDCRRTLEPLRKLPCLPNHFLKCMPSFPQFLQEVPVEAQWEAQGGEKNDGWGQGMDTKVLAGLTNRLPPSDSLLKLDLARPKVLQDVSCRNSELSCRRHKNSFVFDLSAPPAMKRPSLTCNVIAATWNGD